LAHEQHQPVEAEEEAEAKEEEAAVEPKLMAEMDNLGDFDNEIDEALMSQEHAALLAFSFILKPYDILVDMKTTNFHFSSTCGPGKDRHGQSSGPRVCISSQIWLQIGFHKRILGARYLCVAPLGHLFCPPLHADHPAHFGRVTKVALKHYRTPRILVKWLLDQSAAITMPFYRNLE
jgi:hypothetical protein